MLSQDPLLFAIITHAHDPETLARYRPFASLLLPNRRLPTPATRAAGPGLMTRIAHLTGGFRRPHAAATAACCPSPCC